MNECILVSLFCLAEYISILILMYILDLVVEPPFENLKVNWGDHHFIFRNGREKMCETGNQWIWSLKITLDYSRFKSLVVWILLFTIPNSDKMNHWGIYISLVWGLRHAYIPLAGSTMINILIMYPPVNFYIDVELTHHDHEIIFETGNHS